MGSTGLGGGLGGRGQPVEEAAESGVCLGSRDQTLKAQNKNKNNVRICMILIDMLLMRGEGGVHDKYRVWGGLGG